MDLDLIVLNLDLLGDGSQRPLNGEKLSDLLQLSEL